jgi:hypothetical protein
VRQFPPSTAQRRILRRRHACLAGLDRVFFKAGDSPETIRQNFSSLSLEQVYGAIAFYLAHEGDVDSNIREDEEQTQGSVPHLSEAAPNCTPVLSVPATRSPRRIWRSIEHSFSGGSASRGIAIPNSRESR